MVSFSGKSLSEIRQEIIEWKSRRHLIDDEINFPWTKSHLSVVLDYVLKLEAVDSSAGRSTSWCFDKGWHHREIYAKMVASFKEDLRELFKVPKLQQSSIKKNELLAAFIDFLFQLLYHTKGSNDSIEDRIEGDLKKELRFLLAILGDESLLGAEFEQVQSLLAEFEAVANDSGSLVFSFIADRLFESVRIDKALDALLERIDILKANVIKFLNLLPFVVNPGTTPSTVSQGSLFIVNSFLYDLEDLLNRDDDLIVDMKDQIRTLYEELMLSQSLLKGINFPPHSGMEGLKEPVIQIGEVAYEAEYLINSFLVGDFPPWYFSIRLPHVIQKIKLIRMGLQGIKKDYGIGAFKVAKDFFSEQLSLQTKSNSEVDDVIVGFDDNATDILDQLVGGTEHLQIISIFGMPGLGKTTLAKKLYNHPSVIYKFDKRSCAVVSQTYRRESLLTDILISSTSELDKDRILNMDEGHLVERIYKSLKERRYLIVMDDVWSSNAWDDLRTCFPDDGNGSRILFTSRNKDVAPPNSIIYALPSLSNDQCWELLQKKVFHNKPCPPQLLGIGKEIAANCYGLPLVVVVIGGILSTMAKEESTWKNVGGNLASYVFDGRNNPMMQILELSYKHLPDHLKTCFLYFGLFPEDTVIPVWKLKWLWIAEGFICKKEKKSAESLAEEYLTELIDRSLVIVSKKRSDGGVKACVIHDLLHDLCLRTAEEQNFLKLIDNNYSIYEKHQRLRLHISQASPQLLRPFGLHVRSFLGRLLDTTSEVVNMKLLRVLHLLNATRPRRGDFDGVEYLVHLRYLVITYLPASIGSLVNLEFLSVMTSDYGVAITSAITKMMKLRYLRLTARAVFGQDCNASQTNNLEFLCYVSIRNLKDEEMLKCSPHLRKLKCLYEHRYPDLRFLTQLESLNLTTFFGCVKGDINLPSNIKKLTLSGLRLPWEKMSMIGGLPKLQVLKLLCDAFVGETWDTRDDEFQQLTFLKLGWLRVRQWNVSSSEHFPRLRQLVMNDCYKLQEIPSEIGEIVNPAVD